MVTSDNSATADVLASRRAPEARLTRRRRTAVLTGAAVAAAVVSVALVVNLVPGGDDHDGRKQSVGAAESADDRPGSDESADVKSKSPSATASRSERPKKSVAPSATRNGGAGAGAAPDAGTEDGATAPTVVVNPYEWDGPCGQHYLLDQKPEHVPPPATESEARSWVTSLGGVPGGRQIVALTVQGTGKATVVLEALHVRVAEKSAPLAWNDFEMGVGCGGGVETARFGVDLDAGRPTVSPRSGQRDFPYKVSESDPEVFYIYADARAHNVSWYLELAWSSGNKKGTLRVSDNGKPFRTSGNVGRPTYTHPLGAPEWGRNESEPNIGG